MTALILTPYYGGVDLEHIASVGNLIQRGWTQATITGCALLDHAFGALAGIALRQNKFDMVLFIEHDIIFTPGEAEAIVETARELDAMVAAPCPIKNPRGKLMVSGIIPGQLANDELRFGELGGPVEVFGIPFGFTAMPLHRLREAAEHWCPEGPCRADNGGDIWPMFGCLVNTAADGHRELMTQDYSFCKRLDATGCKRYLDTRRRIVHKGAYPYTVEDSCWSVPLIDDLRIRFVDGEPTPVDASEVLGPLVARGETMVSPQSRDAWQSRVCPGCGLFNWECTCRSRPKPPSAICSESEFCSECGARFNKPCANGSGMTCPRLGAVAEHETHASQLMWDRATKGERFR